MINQKLDECPPGQWKRVDIDGTVTVTLGVPTIAEIQQAIGCNLCDQVLVRRPPEFEWEGVLMLVDDVGLFKGLPINPTADVIYQRQSEPGNPHHIRGVVVIANDTDFALGNPLDE